MSRFVTFGEIMMRLNPEGYNRFVQAERFEASYAGGEANVAVSLANYGLDAAFVTKLVNRRAPPFADSVSKRKTSSGEGRASAFILLRRARPSVRRR